MTGPKRVAAFPDVPTVAGDAIPAVTSTSWQGLVRAGLDAKRHCHEAQWLCTQRVANAGSARGAEDIRQRAGRQYAGTVRPGFKAEVERFIKIVNDLRAAPQD